MIQPFLNSPLGAICLLILGSSALINIYAHWIEDGLIGRLLYMALALSSFAGLLSYSDQTMPVHIIHTIVVIFTLLSVRNVCVRTTRYAKYRKLIHAKKHQ